MRFAAPLVPSSSSRCSPPSCTGLSSALATSSQMSHSQWTARPLTVAPDLSLRTLNVPGDWQPSLHAPQRCISCPFYIALVGFHVLRFRAVASYVANTTVSLVAQGNGTVMETLLNLILAFLIFHKSAGTSRMQSNGI